jgi:hypothetical protein
MIEQHVQGCHDLLGCALIDGTEPGPTPSFFRASTRMEIWD